MLSFLAPNLQLATVLDLTLARLKRLGLRGLLLDLDCTLKDYHAAEIPAAVRGWLTMLQGNGVGLCLLSNGREPRIRSFATHLGVEYVAKALKPLPFGCRRGLKKLGLPPRQVAVVGDQLFADVLAGRLAGLFTILVRPTTSEEPWFTRLKRPLERNALRLLNSTRRAKISAAI